MTTPFGQDSDSGQATAILITLVVYKIVLLAIGLFAQRRTKDGADFFLAGHGLGPLVAAISASASSSSGWTLLGVSGFAYSQGLGALWLFPGCIGGFALNWFLLAPRLRRLGSEQPEAITVTDILAGPRGKSGARAIRILASIIILLSLLTYVASQFQASGKTFAETFDISASSSILLGSVIVVGYTLLGGFWAVSLTDTLQGLIMALTSIVLPLAALMQVGGFAPLAEGLEAYATSSNEHYLSLTSNNVGMGAVGFVAGLLGIGLGYPGQPHVVNRFMALRSDAAVTSARHISLVWAFIVYSGMILLGLCGRVITASVPDGETIFVSMTTELFSPVVAGIMIAAVLSAIMSTADSQLLVAASAVSHDLSEGKVSARTTLLRSRIVIIALSAVSVLIAIYGDKSIFDQVLFAWSAMGCAFGPLLLVRVWSGPIQPLGSLLAMASGFGLSVSFYYFPMTKGAIERIAPFLVALWIAWAYRLRVQPNHAD